MHDRWHVKRLNYETSRSQNQKPQSRPAS
ncbi:hypothetical protein RSAG8_03137, partial [Rhizoctonia solani AG-8 WAC10335]